MNRTILTGRITKDLELKSTQSNIPVVSFTLAVNKEFKDENGDRQADFIQCVAWRKSAELLNQYCGKGSLIGIEGRLSTRQYDSDNGTKYITEVVCDHIEFLEPKKQEKEEVKDEFKQEDYEQVKRGLDELSKKPVAQEEDLPF